MTPERKIILIERAFSPEGVALPGGFVDVGESCKEAAMREALEEVGVNIEIKKLLGEWSDPSRDPREHNVTLAYLAEIAGGNIKAGDDARKIVLVDPSDINSLDFAFPDHKEIIISALDCV